MMRTLDLFAGCGGLSLGFEENGFETVGFLDSEKSCMDVLKHNFANKTKPTFVHDDIRNSFSNPNNDCDKLIKRSIEENVDGIIGGPPCQAYSLAGRVRDPDKMKLDYRNYLFESYIDWIKKINPSFFIFENVVGMLSAKPDGPPIVDLISKSFKDIDFSIPEIDGKIVFNLSSFGGAQNRKRVIIFGVNNKKIKNGNEVISRFYDVLSNQFKKPKTVYDSIGDLEKLFPLKNPTRRISHKKSETDLLHRSRFHSIRDMEIFKILAKDQMKNDPQFSDVKNIKKLYEDIVGRTSNVHKYYVLRWNDQSNLIPAHLHKDGLRHIHPDPSQSRSISMREAARLQNFPDSFIFENTQSNIFKMIGNAVSPLMADKIAFSIKQVMSL